MSEPRVGIIVLNYNRADTLGRCLESVRAQTYESAWTVIADNASSDRSLRVARTFEGSRIRTLVRPVNVGFVANMNLALGEPEVKEADYVAILHSDDWWEPGFLETIVNAMELAPSALLGTCAACLVTPQAGSEARIVAGMHDISGEGIIPSARAADILSHGNRMYAPTVLARRRLYDLHPGYDAALNSVVDWLMWLRAATAGDIVVSALPLANYTVHQASESGGNHLTYAWGTDLLRVRRLIELEWSDAHPFPQARRRIRERIPLLLLGEAHWLLRHGDADGARFHARLAWAAAPDLRLRALARAADLGVRLRGVPGVRLAEERVSHAMGDRLGHPSAGLTGSSGTSLATDGGRGR